MNRTAHARPVTEDEFLSLPESHDRLELIDGEIFMAPSPRPRHQVLVGRLFRILHEWADANAPAFVGLSPLDVRIAPGRIVQPDLFLLLGGLRSRDQMIEATPELVIEVLSANRSHDRLTKRLVYLEAGVAEYWLVDPEDALIDVVTRGDESRSVRDRLVSDVAVGLEVDVTRLFAD